MKKGEWSCPWLLCFDHDVFMQGWETVRGAYALVLAQTREQAYTALKRNYRNVRNIRDATITVKEE